MDKKKLNLLLFSGDYDKALAALILADAACNMEMDVTIFCAFWGLLLVRDPEKLSSEDSDLYEKMLGWMTPDSVEDLPLSKMNMGWMGQRMLKQMMKDKNAGTLQEYLDDACRRNVKFYACKLSMEVMGLDKEELLPKVEVMRAGDYLKDALQSDIQLFI